MKLSPIEISERRIYNLILREFHLFKHKVLDKEYNPTHLNNMIKFLDEGSLVFLKKEMD